MNTSYYRTKGFTLIELLVVISIIALLSSVILAALQGARQKGIVAATQTFEINLKSALYDSGPGAIQDFYSFNGTSGNTVPDEIGGNTLILNPSILNPSVCSASSLNNSDTPDGSSQSLSLITADSCAQFTNPITPGNAFTISFWVKTTKENYSSIFSNRAGGDFVVEIYFKTPDVYINNATNSVSGNGHFTAKNYASDGKWHLITYSFLLTSPGNGSWVVYFDGKVDTKSTFTYSGLTPYTKSTATYLGYDPVQSTWNFTGLIDDFAIYDQAISDNQAYEIYALEAPAHGIALNLK